MAELMKRQGSIFEGNHPSCMSSFLQLFDLHRIQSRKMISYRRHEDGRNTGRAKVPKPKLHQPSTIGEHSSSESEANTLMEDKLLTAKSSSKTRVRNLFSKLYKKQDQKQNISPLASQLTRTISIHHLECNDYVPDGMTSDSETSTADLFSHETDYSASNHPSSSDDSVSEQHLSTKKAGDELQSHSSKKQLLIQKELNKAKEYLLKLKDADGKELGRNASFMLELFNSKRQLFQMDIVDPNSTSADYVQNGQHSSSEPVLARSRSFPGAGPSSQSGGLPELKHKGNATVVDQQPKSQSEKSHSVQNTIKDDLRAPTSTSDVREDTLKQIPDSLDSTQSSSFESSPDSRKEPKKQKTYGNVLTRFKVLKQRIKSAFIDNKKEHQRISMDGVLHKIPYGNQIHEDVEKENLRLREAPASNRYDKDSLGFKKISNGTVAANNKYKYGTLPRSRSLAESLDRYSRLYESISVRETRRPPERLKSIKENEKKPQITWGRISSNPEFGRFAFPQIASRESSNSLVSSMISTFDRIAEDDADDTCDSVKPKSASTLVDTEDKMNSETGVVQHVIEDRKEELINECWQTGPCQILDDITEKDSRQVLLHDDAAMDELTSGDMLKPTPNSTPDSYFPEDSVSPIKYLVSEEDSELKPGWVNFEDPDPAVNYVSNSMEVGNADSDDKLTLKDLTDFGSMTVQVNQNDETKFNYVTEILKMSGFYSENSLKAWYSPEQPLSPSLFEEALHEPDIQKNETNGTTVNWQLLFDLINEVLLDIYGNSFSHNLGFSLFGSSLRPKPVGNRLLEEVWANISWHHSYQTDLNPTLEYISARDFLKNDGWMDLKQDSEFIGIEIGDQVLDDLLDEVLLEFEASTTMCDVS